MKINKEEIMSLSVSEFKTYKKEGKLKGRINLDLKLNVKKYQ